MRTDAERIVKTYPDPSPAEIERARVVLEKGHVNIPLDVGDLEPYITPLFWELGVNFMIWVAVFSIVAALFRGGLLMRALGIAVVRRDGSDASCGRMLWRACLAWSWLPAAAFATALLDNTPGNPGTPILIVGLPLLALLLISAALSDRSLPDRLAGTWLVPR
jgi:hypothetical protein